MYLFLYGLWLILNGKLTWEICIFGVGIVAALGLLMYALLDYTPKKEWRYLRRVPLFLFYLLVLLWEIIKANLTVIEILFDRKRALQQSLITFTVDLKTQFARFVLANSITLTPGTITVQADGNRFTVHCLSREMLDGIEESTFVHLLRKLEA